MTSSVIIGRLDPEGNKKIGFRQYPECIMHYRSDMPFPVSVPNFHARYPFSFSVQPFSILKYNKNKYTQHTQRNTARYNDKTRYVLAVLEMPPQPNQSFSWLHFIRRAIEKNQSIGSSIHFKRAQSKPPRPKTRISFRTWLVIRNTEALFLFDTRRRINYPL